MVVIFYYDENHNYLGNYGTWSNIPYQFNLFKNTKYLKFAFKHIDGSDMNLSEISSVSLYLRKPEFYSTEEQVIGYWFDYPLYGKGMKGTTGTTTIALLSGCEFVVRCIWLCSK